MNGNAGLLKGIFRVFQYFLCLAITVEIGRAHV